MHMQSSCADKTVCERVETCEADSPRTRRTSDGSQSFPCRRGGCGGGGQGTGGGKGGDLNAHGIKVFAEGLPSVVCIISKQVDLHLWQPLLIPCCADAYRAVITVIWGLSRLLFDECVPVEKESYSIH